MGGKPQLFHAQPENIGVGLPDSYNRRFDNGNKQRGEIKIFQHSLHVPVEIRNEHNRILFRQIFQDGAGLVDAYLGVGIAPVGHAGDVVRRSIIVRQMFVIQQPLQLRLHFQPEHMPKIMVRKHDTVLS
jgi:hypothetical protein